MEIVIVSSGAGGLGAPVYSDISKLEERINKYLEKGFRLHGSVYACMGGTEPNTYIIHYQAMIKQERDRVDD